VTPTGIVVQKYGGSSVADAERIKLVAQRIARTKAAGKKVVVVVSAMGKTTNQLIEKARSISAAPSRRELDMLLTCGEREAMALLSMACSEEGLEAISFTGSQAGILTNDRHSGARIVEVRPFRIEDELDRGKVVIVAGFQGVSDSYPTCMPGQPRQFLSCRAVPYPRCRIGRRRQNLTSI
jgi:aspartate kinase